MAVEFSLFSKLNAALEPGGIIFFYDMLAYDTRSADAQFGSLRGVNQHLAAAGDTDRHTQFQPFAADVHTGTLNFPDEWMFHEQRFCAALLPQRVPAIIQQRVIVSFSATLDIIGLLIISLYFFRFLRDSFLSDFPIRRRMSTRTTSRILLLTTP